MTETLLEQKKQVLFAQVRSEFFTYQIWILIIFFFLNGNQFAKGHVVSGHSAGESVGQNHTQPDVVMYGDSLSELDNCGHSIQAWLVSY